jgi:hypothetical protein
MIHELPKLKPPCHNEFLYTAGKVTGAVVEAMSQLLDRIEELELQLARKPDAWVTVQRVTETKRIVGLSKIVKTQREAELCYKQWNYGWNETATEFAVMGVWVKETV